MQNKHPKFSAPLLGFIFLCSPSVCLSIDRFRLTPWQLQFGELAHAQTVDISQQQGKSLKTDNSSVWNSLGKVYINLALENYRRAKSAWEAGDNDQAEELRKQALSYDAKAVKYIDESVNIARQRSDKLAEIQALLNKIKPLNRICKTQTVSCSDAAVQRASLLLEELPDSSDKVHAAIELANFVYPQPEDAISLPSQCPQPTVETQTIASVKLLNQAVSIARRLQDSKGLSSALGHLGHTHECRGDYDKAIRLTRQAQAVIIQKLDDKDNLYLWEWQEGRILKAQNKPIEAIKAYERAVAILANHQDLKLNFQSTIEPIYRELAELRLEQLWVSSNKQHKTLSALEEQKNLSGVLKIIDSLKLAELQHYCGDDCVLTPIDSQNIKQSDVKTGTAVFSSIIFPERTIIVLSLPNGEKKHVSIEIDSETLRQKINKFRIGLENRGNPTYEPKQAQQLYDWIIRPFADDLKASQIKTLVFIQDGILRSVPMGALHDGEKFLIQNYAIATTPSLNLMDSNTMNREGTRALVVGLTKDAVVDGKKYHALSNVASEISKVKTKIPGSKQLLDENFTPNRLQQELSQDFYPIIHIATHGEFGALPEDTFLVTGNNDKLTITDIHALIRMIEQLNFQVDLLTLTACQTAIGDDGAALGLAGVAVQAGVKSALASLWSIDDAATVTFVTKFYEYWYRDGMSKAEALQAAQQELISLGGKYAHPFYWAPYTLVGNWL
jgi:CHAT domain-containing protein